MREDPFDIPAAADEVTDDAVKQIGAVLSSRSSGADDLLDLVNAVAGLPLLPLKPVGIRCGSFCSCGLTALAQMTAQSSTRSILRELANGVEPIAGDRQCLVRAAEQLGCYLLAVELKRRISVSVARRSLIPIFGSRCRSASPRNSCDGRCRESSVPTHQCCRL